MAGKIAVERGASGIFKVRFTDPSGRRVQVSARTRDKRQAEEFGARLYSEAWRVQHLGDRPRRTWQQAADRWIEERSGKRSIGKDAANLDWLHPHLAHLRLDEITAQRIADVARTRAGEPHAKTGRTPSDATVNRMLALVRAILRACVEWEWLDRAPVVRLRQERAERMRWLTREQAARLIEELPAHLKSPAMFALATGLREQNVLRLEWAQVDLERRVAWVHADQAKAGSGIAVPLNAEAVACLREQRGAHERWCFPGPNGGPIVRANNHGWRSAIVRAGVAPLRWHDLRHTWASWHVQSGTPLEVLMRLGGWRSLSMVMRYAHLSPGHLSAHADAIGPILVQSQADGQDKVR